MMGNRWDDLVSNQRLLRLYGHIARFPEVNPANWVYIRYDTTVTVGDQGNALVIHDWASQLILRGGAWYGQQLHGSLLGWRPGSMDGE